MNLGLLNKTTVFTLTLLFVSLTCLWAQQQDVPEPVFMNFSIQPLYIPTYHGRDPFKPLNNMDRSPQVSIADLDYHGVLYFGETPMALFTWKGNSAVQYVLKYRRLANGGGKFVDGVVGDISESAVILVQGDQKIVYTRK